MCVCELTLLLSCCKLPKGFVRIFKNNQRPHIEYNVASSIFKLEEHSKYLLLHVFVVCCVTAPHCTACTRIDIHTHTHIHIHTHAHINLSAHVCNGRVYVFRHGSLHTYIYIYIYTYTYICICIYIYIYIYMYICTYIYIYIYIYACIYTTYTNTFLCVYRWHIPSVGGAIMATIFYSKRKAV